MVTVGENARPWVVMISSVMGELTPLRERIAEVITSVDMKPWLAEQQPNAFRAGANERLSYIMAEDCDLYLLLISTRYGSKDPETERSITHEEFLLAKKTPRKVRVFIRRNIEEDVHIEPELSAFVREIKDFKKGFTYTEFSTDEELLEKIRDVLIAFRDEGELARLAYVKSVLNALGDTFENRVTGRQWTYDDTVQLRVRTEERPSERSSKASPEEEMARARRNRVDGDGDGPTHAIIALADEFLNSYGHLLLLGEVGSGKTTLLRRLHHDAAVAYLDQRQEYLPILLSAKDLGQFAEQHRGLGLADVVAELQVAQTNDVGIKQEIRYTIAAAIERGNAFLLIDSLDEATPNQRRVLIGLLGEVGKNRAILATRPVASPGSMAGWRTCNVQRLDAAQQHLLIRRVFRDLQDSITGKELKVSDLVQELRSRAEDLAEWAGNPLLLTLVTLYYAQYGTLLDGKASVASLYKNAATRLREQRKRTSEQHRYEIDDAEAEQLLEALALAMTLAAARTTSIEEAERSIGDLVARRIQSGNLPNAPTHALIEQVLDRSGVLGHEEGRYEWLHLSFREYFTASALAHESDAQRDEHLRRHRLHEQWDQVWPLAVSCLDGENSEKADQLIISMLDADDRIIPVLHRRDPLHISLQIATRCHFSRPEALRNASYLARLRGHWLRLWRQTVRPERSYAESASVIDWLHSLGISSIYLNGVPFEASDMLKEGIPFLLDDLLRRRPVGRWQLLWTMLFVLDLFMLALLTILVQVSLNVSTLARTAWGMSVAAWAPGVILGALIVLLLTRVAIYLNWGAHLRKEWLARLLPYYRPGRGTKASYASVLRLCHDKDKDMRQMALRALGGSGAQLPDDGVAAVIEGLHDPVPTVRQVAAAALRRLGDRVPDAGVAALVEGVRENQGYTRYMMAWALEVFGARLTREHLSELAPFLQDERSDVRQELAEILAGRPSDLSDDDYTAIFNLAFGGQIEHDVAVRLAVLAGSRTALRRGDPRIQDDVKEILEGVGDPRLVYIAHHLRDVDASWVQEEIHLEYLKSPDVGTVEKINNIRILDTIGARLSEQGIQALTEAMSDADWRVRVVAARALIGVGPRITEGQWLGYLKDPHPRVQRIAIEALGTMGDRLTDAGLTALRAMLSIPTMFGLPTIQQQSDIEGRRLAAAEALNAIGVSPVDDDANSSYLMLLLSDIDIRVREMVSRGMTTAGNSFFTVSDEETGDIDYQYLSDLCDVVFERPGITLLGRRTATYLQYLTDWPVLALIIAAQVIRLWPDLLPLPSAFAHLLMWSAWWQVLLLEASIIFFYAVTRVLSYAILVLQSRLRHGTYPVITHTLRNALQDTLVKVPPVRRRVRWR